MTASRRRFSPGLLLLALTTASAQAQSATPVQDAAGNRLEALHRPVRRPPMRIPRRGTAAPTVPGACAPSVTKPEPSWNLPSM